MRWIGLVVAVLMAAMACTHSDPRRMVPMQGDYDATKHQQDIAECRYEAKRAAMSPRGLLFGEFGQKQHRKELVEECMYARGYGDGITPKGTSPREQRAAQDYDRDFEQCRGAAAAQPLSQAWSHEMRSCMQAKGHVPPDYDSDFAECRGLAAADPLTPVWNEEMRECMTERGHAIK